VTSVIAWREMRWAWSLAAACSIVVLTGARSSRAAGESKVRCAAAYEQAQELRRQDKLAASREQLRICEATCPRALAADCKRWDGELDALTPTVRLRATDAQGHPIDARVLMDGVLLVNKAADNPVEVETGDHTFRFESATGATEEAKVTLHGGERDKEIAVVFGAAPAPAPLPVAPAEEPRSVPAATWVLGSIGVAGLGVGLGLTLDGHVQANHLQSTCSPACEPSKVNAIATLYDVAWVSGGVGLAAVATALFLWRPWETSPSPSRARVLVTPTVGGALAQYRF
jgi:hypothetical protein